MVSCNSAIKFKKFHEDAVIPQYAHKYDSGMDLISIDDVIIPPKGVSIINTGIGVQLPDEYFFIDFPGVLEAQVRSRSGLASKHGIFVLNSPGTIDNEYRGEIKVILCNTSNEAFHVEKGMKIAQLVIAPVVLLDSVEVEELSDSERGENGFNSTGLFMNGLKSSIKEE